MSIRQSRQLMTTAKLLNAELAKLLTRCCNSHLQSIQERVKISFFLLNNDFIFTYELLRSVLCNLEPIKTVCFFS